MVPHEDVVLVFLMLPLGISMVLALEELCLHFRCPKGALPLPAVVATLIVVPMQHRLLDLWRKHQRVVMITALAAYGVLGSVFWGVLTNRITRWQ